MAVWVTGDTHGDWISRLKVNSIRPLVIHLMRGQILNIEDKLFFAFGGASSHDISAGILEPDAPDFKEKRKRLNQNPFALYRINHVRWWVRSSCIYEQIIRIL